VTGPLTRNGSGAAPAAPAKLNIDTKAAQFTTAESRMDTLPQVDRTARMEPLSRGALWEEAWPNFGAAETKWSRRRGGHNYTIRFCCG
jgi:hypothetical protein